MPSTLGLLNFNDEETDTVLKQYSSGLDDAKRSILEKGFSMPTKPISGFNGQIPSDTVSLGDDELGDLLVQLSNWIEWAEIEMMQIKAQVDASKKKVDFLHSNIRIASRNSGEKMTVQDKLDVTNCDKRVIEEEAKLLFYEAQYDLIRVMVNGAKTNWDTISRRITQRGQDLERMKRVDNVNNQTSNLRSPFRRP